MIYVKFCFKLHYDGHYAYISRVVGLSALPPIGTSVFLPDLDDDSITVEEIKLIPGNYPEWTVMLHQQQWDVGISEVIAYYKHRGYLIDA